MSSESFAAGDILRIKSDAVEVGVWVVLGKSELRYELLYIKEKTFEIRDYTIELVHMACELNA